MTFLKKAISQILVAALLLGTPLMLEAGKKRKAAGASKTVNVKQYKTKKGKTVKAHKRRAPRR